MAASAPPWEPPPRDGRPARALHRSTVGADRRARTFITSGTRADLVTAAVRTGGPGHAGISLLVIEKGTPGFSVSRALKKTGWWASDTAELRFEGCRVPVANLIGKEHGAFPMIVANFAAERIMLAA